MRFYRFPEKTIGILGNAYKDTFVSKFGELSDEFKIKFLDCHFDKDIERTT